MLDDKTLQMVNEIFGDKPKVSLTALSAALGFEPETMQRMVLSGTLKTISTGKHQYITRPMLIDFLLNGGGVTERAKITRAPSAMGSELKMAALRYKEERRQARRSRK